MIINFNSPLKALAESQSYELLPLVAAQIGINIPRQKPKMMLTYSTSAQYNGA